MVKRSRKPKTNSPGRPPGEILAEARQTAGLTQEAVARALELTKGQLSQIESGSRANPRFSTVARIAYVLGLSLDDVAAQCGLWPNGHRVGAQNLDGPEYLKAREEIRRAIGQTTHLLQTLKSAEALAKASTIRRKRKS